MLEAIALRKKVNNCDDARKTQANQPAINKNMTLPHPTLFPESPSQIPNLPHTKLLYLYSALYNEHQTLRRMAKKVLERIQRRIRDMKVLQHPHTANHKQL
ncbi:hypothetical protein M5S64_18295 [Enterobacter hormaechei]|nr:hypothetical protein [Enterobacter hormaechei]UWA09210.1 hypothetical protein M5S64_18295 [Enterobacter hormaechei]